jgi:hypothetical protein
MNARLDSKSRRHEATMAAIKMGVPPSVFDGYGEMDRARIIAGLRIDRLFEAHVSKVQRDVAEEESKNKGKGGGGPDPAYDAFSAGGG